MQNDVSGEILVSIVVPCRNEAAYIGPLLDCVLTQENLPGRIEVLIADGMSDDGTRDTIASYANGHPEIILLDNPERIVSTGLNRAIKRAKGDYVIRLDVHTSFSVDYIAQSIRVLEETGADNVGGAARVRASGTVPEAIAAAYASPFAVGGANFHFPEYEGPVDTVPYGCWRRSYLLDIGLFDVDLVRNQDDELNLRIVRNGGRIWQSKDIKSWYFPRSSLKQLFRQYFQYGFWKIAVFRKHRIPASVRHVVPSLFVGSLSLLGAGALLWDPVVWLFAAEVGAYLMFLLIGSVVVASNKGWHLFPLLGLVLMTFHVSYGLGSIMGLLTGRKAGQVSVASDLSR